MRARSGHVLTFLSTVIFVLVISAATAQAAVTVRFAALYPQPAAAAPPVTVLPVGVARTGAWRYAFIYEIVQRHFPELPELARQIRRSEALRLVVMRYLDHAVAADQKMIGQVFNVLRWTSSERERTIATLLEEGAIEEVHVRGLKHPRLVSARGLEHEPAFKALSAERQE